MFYFEANITIVLGRNPYTYMPNTGRKGDSQNVCTSITNVKSLRYVYRIPLSDDKHQMVGDSSKKCTGQRGHNSNPVAMLPHAAVVFHMQQFNSYSSPSHYKREVEKSSQEQYWASQNEDKIRAKIFWPIFADSAQWSRANEVFHY